MTQATKVVVELDAERIREQVRASVVEILEERDRARETAVLLEQQLAEALDLVEAALIVSEGSGLVHSVAALRRRRDQLVEVTA